MNPILLVLERDTGQYISKIKKEYKTTIYKQIDKITHSTTIELYKVNKIFLSIENLSIEEEIFYFKKIKVPLLALIQYCSYIRILEAKKPALKYRKLKNYYLQQLDHIKQKITKNDTYYSYWFSEDNNWDNKYFVRLKNNTFQNFSGIIVEIDHISSTPYVPIFAKVLALSYLKEFIKDKIKSFGNKNIPEQNKREKLKWTSSKVDLIEMIYAFHTAGSFNNGKADLKEIAEYFEDAFDIDLGQYNRVFFDIRARKTNKTKYIDSIKSSLIKKMKETDDELFI